MITHCTPPPIVPDIAGALDVVYPFIVRLLFTFRQSRPKLVLLLFYSNTDTPV